MDKYAELTYGLLTFLLFVSSPSNLRIDDDAQSDVLLACMTRTLSFCVRQKSYSSKPCLHENRGVSAKGVSDRLGTKDHTDYLCGEADRHPSSSVRGGMGMDKEVRISIR